MDKYNIILDDDLQEPEYPDYGETMGSDCTGNCTAVNSTPGTPNTNPLGFGLVMGIIVTLIVVGIIGRVKESKLKED